MLILISDTFDPSLPDRLSAFGEVTEDKERLGEADVVLIRSATKCTREYIDSAPNLKLIIRGGVGLDNVARPYAEERGIMVRNTPKASGIAVAEMAFALMLAVASRVTEAHESMAAGRWDKKQLKRTELSGKTLCLVGMGNIASEVAKRAHAFGMNVVAYRRSGKPSDLADVRPSLAQAVADADYVSLHTPLTDQTRGMIDARVIAGMKDGAALINTGRGAAVVEADVASALQSGKLRAYATDVWPSDPPPADCPILKAPNVIMAPHLGASTKENLLRIGEEAHQIVQQFAMTFAQGIK
jgi:D-3-phosphoglycerate dehydrogenase / 2-oxoglutarate reductase